eukprot:TRINITY_DN20701_c0_g1_i1.p1 TRINITY_DN20701_c0_g1~~TRINITY_DN20701_c0_g1_i1.p1  ORF type:complete len:113 (-),score=14.18 TRINITY_DN20701_c0_g1_i1:46-384(-)
MRARHILVKHQGSRRPASWKDPEGIEISARSREQAIAMLNDIRASIRTPEDFARVAQTASDCSSARNGGDLGEFGPGQMQKAFEDGVLALAVGDISGVVESDSGVHIILRTG